MTCGFGTAYSVTKPAACGKCKKPLVAIASVVKPKVTPELGRYIPTQEYPQPKPFIIHDKEGNTFDLNDVNPKRLLEKLNLGTLDDDEIQIENTTDVDMSQLASQPQSKASRPSTKRKPRNSRGSRKQIANLAQEFFSEGNGEANRDVS